MAIPSEDYFLDTYGTCELGAPRCSCLKKEWLGRGCLHWQPLGVKSFDDLKEHVKNEARKAKSG